MFPFCNLFFIINIIRRGFFIIYIWMFDALKKWETLIMY